MIFRWFPFYFDPSTYAHHQTRIDTANRGGVVRFLLFHFFRVLDCQQGFGSLEMQGVAPNAFDMKGMGFPWLVHGAFAQQQVETKPAFMGCLCDSEGDTSPNRIRPGGPFAIRHLKSSALFSCFVSLRTYTNVLAMPIFCFRRTRSCAARFMQTHCRLLLACTAVLWGMVLMLGRRSRRIFTCEFQCLYASSCTKPSNC